MAVSYKVIDLFAGPGGLAEGFSACRRSDGSKPFEIALSVEKEASAHATLRLRAFLRQFDTNYPQAYYDALNHGREQPDWAQLFPEQWKAAEREAQLLELGTREANSIISSRIAEIRAEVGNDTILIGGPPCQAYSLVGRARNSGTEGYRAEDDGRHFLYREYIAVLEKLRPAAFVMENVKGLLSSKVGGHSVVARILADLRKAGHHGYTLVPLVPAKTGMLDLGDQAPGDFVVRAERLGIPQARHRVIIVGIRNDRLKSKKSGPEFKALIETLANAGDVLEGLPPLRSGLTSRADSDKAWQKAVSAAIKQAVAAASDGASAKVARHAREAQRRFAQQQHVLGREASAVPRVSDTCSPKLSRWLLDRRVRLAPNHSSRGHMDSDLARYFFCAVFAEAEGRSPRAEEFPPALSPDHANWKSGKFADRFKVQVRSAPSSTITSHISKDGHYFIHPDPLQCRSLTVREAARLQTFPDNYLFLGNRTQQYVQVGNAVPPFLALRISELLLSLMEREPQGKRRTRLKVGAHEKALHAS